MSEKVIKTPPLGGGREGSGQGGPPTGWHGMPMLRKGVPEWLGIFCYFLFPIFFQLSGGVYAGALGEIVGEEGCMQQDIMLLVYCNLAGLAVYFPLLFRMKFRFTNKQLIIFAASGALVCNVLMMILPNICGGYHGVAFPLMMVVCFVEGMFKLQGTFEHISNIQTWFTPKRDFRVFFPVLHIVIMTGVNGIGIIATYCAYYAHFYYVNYIIILMMILVLLFQFICCKPFRPTLVPFEGIDWLGMVIWSIFSVEVAWLFTYGEWAEWTVSPTWRTVAWCTVATFLVGLIRVNTVKHAWVEGKIFRLKTYIPFIIIGTMLEVLMATENSLEETFYEGVMHWSSMQTVVLKWTTLGGSWIGCLIALWWMKYNNWNKFRLYTFGVFLMTFYHIGFYFLISRDILPDTLMVPVLLRGIVSSMTSAAMLTLLNGMFDFQHFFQALSMYQFVHVALTGSIGGAIYGRLMDIFIPDNSVVYGSAGSPTVIEVSLKEVFGIVVMVDILLFFGCLFYKHPVRRRIQRIPMWKAVGKKMKRGLTKPSQEGRMF